jgi:hypothetical protein
MPEVFRIFGIRFYFYANEHLPIHIHVQNANGKAKFQVLPTIKLIDNKGLKSSEIKLAEGIIEENKILIIRSWEAFHGKMD